MITHLVFFWVDKDDANGKAAVLKGANDLLSTIPGAKNFRSGPAFSSQRGAVDDTFSAAICMDFDSKKEMDAYLAHPDHVSFINDCLKPYVKRYVVYDIEA